jgi:hypothetical protein
MIPAFNENGYLPPGIHPATLEEIAERFGQESELRRDQMESLHWLVDLARRAGVRRLIINGSFVTDTFEPNDVDCILVVVPGYRRDSKAAEELERGLPFLDIDLVEPEGLDELVEIFARNRDWMPKGMIEVIQWN